MKGVTVKEEVIVAFAVDASTPTSSLSSSSTSNLSQVLHHHFLQRVIEDGQPSKKDVPPKKAKPQDNPMTRPWQVASSMGTDVVQIDCEPSFLGRPNHVDLWITQKDVLEMFTGNDILNISVLQLWLLYMHHLCLSKGRDNVYGFIDPFPIQKIGNKNEDYRAYIQNWIFNGQKRCYLVPYLHCSHWQLLIICPRNNIVALLCSLHKKPNKELKQLVEV